MDTIYDAKLLIVDDNAELLALLCEQLRGAGYGHIRTAQSCAAARACFAAEQPELMILDINLPDGDGFSLFRALRAKADVPALFCCCCFPVLRCWAGWVGRRAAACRSGSIHPARSRIPWWRPPKGLPLGQNVPRRSG